MIIFYGKYDETCEETTLDKRAVVCDSKIFELDRTHDSIPSDRKAFSRFNEILNKEPR